jgi:hypothetical protein
VVVLVVQALIGRLAGVVVLAAVTAELPLARLMEMVEHQEALIIPDPEEVPDQQSLAELTGQVHPVVVPADMNIAVAVVVVMGLLVIRMAPLVVQVGIPFLNTVATEALVLLAAAVLDCMA